MIAMLIAIISIKMLSIILAVGVIMVSLTIKITSMNMHSMVVMVVVFLMIITISRPIRISIAIERIIIIVSTVFAMRGLRFL